MHRKITKVVITTAAGREITVEGPGTANLDVRTTDGQPSAVLIVSMPVAARLEKGKGDIGTYVKTDVVL